MDIFDRYQECGVQGLTDRSRRPYRYANQLPFQVENFILNVKHEHPSWGARKIRERLLRRFSGIPIPCNDDKVIFENPLIYSAAVFRVPGMN
jgi:putative transposase